MKGQKIRKSLLLLSFILLPVILNYFSPVLVILASFEGIIGGALVVWIIMFVSSLFIGRAWCSHICPYGGWQMVIDKTIDKKLIKIKWLRGVKYILGILWVGFITYAIYSAAGLSEFNFFYNTEKVVSVDQPASLILYYTILGGLALFSFIFGKRGTCNYFCPMSILNIAGTKVKNFLKIPSLHLESDSTSCRGCQRCNKACPMSLDVMSMVQNNNMNTIECILCGECSTACKDDCIKRRFGSPNQNRTKDLSISK